jgi:hypothetical protein
LPFAGSNPALEQAPSGEKGGAVKRLRHLAYTLEKGLDFLLGFAVTR